MTNQSLSLVLNQNYDQFSQQDTDEEPSTQSNVSGLSSKSKRICKKRTKYQRIDDNIRQKIIDAVVNEGQMLKTAAKKYKINYSSAKSIFHTYRKEGRINKKAVRERNAKKYSLIGQIPESKESTNSDSNDSPATLDSPKDSPHLSALKSFEKLEIPQSLLIPTSLKASKIDQTPSTTEKLLQSEQLFSKINITAPSSTGFPFTLPMAMQNPNFAQHMIAQVNNLRMCEELANLQRMLRAQMPFALGKSLVNGNVNPASGYATMQGLQRQMQGVPLGLDAINSQKIAYNGRSAFAGLNYLGNLGM